MPRIAATLLLVVVGLVSMALANTEIVYWTHEDPNRTELESRLIAEFELDHPGITVRRVTHPSVNLGQLLLTAFAAGRGPDVFNDTIANQYPYIVNERVAPVDSQAMGYASLEDVYAGYLEGTLDPVTFDGNLYGIPLEVTNWVIFLNKNVFEDAGLDPEADYPKTWEEMMEVSERLVIRDGEIIQRRGFDFRYPYYLEFLVPMVEQLGGQLISDDGTEAIVDDAAWLHVLGYMREWGPHGRNLGSPTYRNARALFNFDNDDIAMAHTGQYQIARIQADNPEFYDSGQWMIVPFPRWENAVNDQGAAYYGHYFMVNAQSSAEHQEAAWKLIGYFAQHAEAYFETSALVQPTHELLASAAYRDHPYSSVFAADMATANSVYYGANSPRIQQLLKDAVEAVMLQDREPADVLPSLRDGVERALRDEF
jgi:multiple sugar transport system substrate-binding protein